MADDEQQPIEVEDEHIKGHTVAHKWSGALRGPLGRIRTTPPTKYREGNRQGYPIIHLNSPEQNVLAEFPENMFFTTKFVVSYFLHPLLIFFAGTHCGPLSLRYYLNSFERRLVFIFC